MKPISKETIKFLLELQQNEITEHAMYLNLAKFVKKEDDKQILINIGKEELAHAKILEKYTNKKLKPQKFKVFIYFILSFIFGYTFVIKIMESGEKSAEYIYSKIVIIVFFNVFCRCIIFLFGQVRIRFEKLFFRKVEEVSHLFSIVNKRGDFNVFHDVSFLLRWYYAATARQIDLISIRL